VEVEMKVGETVNVGLNNCPSVQAEIIKLITKMIADNLLAIDP
jgi:hypothetical protein